MEALFQWIAALDAASAFFFALPFIVAAGAGIAEAVRAFARSRRRATESAAYDRRPQHGKHAWS